MVPLLCQAFCRLRGNKSEQNKGEFLPSWSLHCSERCSSYSYLSIEWVLFPSWNIVRHRRHSNFFEKLASRWKHCIPYSVISVSEAIVQLGNKPYTVILISPLAFFSCKMSVLDYQTICKVWAPCSSGLMALMCSKILLILYSDFDTPYTVQWLTLNYFQIIL